MTSNTNKKIRIVFPENNGFVISEIIKKNGLDETEDEILKKMMNGEETTAKKIAKIVRQVAEETISIEEFPYKIQKALDIPIEKAKKISLELYKKVIALAEKLAPETRNKKSTLSTIKIKPTPKKPTENTRETQPIRPTRPTKPEGCFLLNF
jgi:hypothetical protein